LSILLDIPIWLTTWSNPFILCGGLIFESRHGLYFFVRSKSDDLYHVTPGREGIIEKFIYSKLKDGDTFVDVGANIGYYTLVAAKKVTPKGKVIAIDAIKDNINTLRINLALNNLKNVITINKATWSESGKKIDFRIPKRYFTSFGQSTSKRTISAVIVESVDSMTLDDLCSEYDSMIMIKVLKIDAEGAEEKIIRGARGILTKTSYLYIECEKDNTSILRDLLSKAGFKIICYSTRHADHLLYARACHL
jgi:FkbM family methyltransferase